MNSDTRGDRSRRNRLLSLFRKKYSSRTYCILAIGLAVLILTAVGIAYINSSVSTNAKKIEPPDPESPLPPSPSILRRFTRAAVCSDGAPCSEIGRDILLKNGSAVDAAIATLFCNGVVNCQSMGLGGGFLMTIYDRKTQTSYFLNARELAPAAASEDMFRIDPNLAKEGALAVGVPGELAGYWAAHQRFGRLPWPELVKPTLKICKYGYKMTKHQYDSLNFRPEAILKDDIFRELFVNASTGKFHTQGTKIIQNRVCKTLEVIAQEGGDSLYNGTLAKTFVSDIQSMGGIITLEDMQNYRVQWTTPATIKSRDYVFFSAPPPGSGALVALIINILEGYNFSSQSMSSLNESITTYHRIAEAFKFAFAKRTELGDPRFINMTEIVQHLTAKETGELLRSKIRDDTTFDDPKYYGATFINQEDHGTAHVSVLSEEGDAVSVTSTINLYFGAAITSKNTGIVLNSGMDDFSSSYFRNYFNLPRAEANKLEPRKQPLSSMCPTIIVDRNGDVRMVVGAAGGTKITTAVPYVILRHLWFNEDIKAAVDHSRIHHQLFPANLAYEYGITQNVVSGLKKLGHKLERMRNRSSVVCAIAQINKTIFANADFRKGGDVHGF